jgi:hypothetical protein
MEVIMLVAVVCFILGLLLIGIYIADKRKEQKEKGFFVIAGTVLLLYLYPGIALIVIAIILMILLSGGYIHL